MKKIKFLALAFVVMLTTFMTASCSKEEDDPSASGTLKGTWVLEETSAGSGYAISLKMTLTFRGDNTGSIVENWVTETRASNSETYEMNFSWSTTSDSNGNDILRVSYVSGDQNTELFTGSGSTALWNRQYVVTGNILNVYGDDGVWVFHRK